MKQDNALQEGYEALRNIMKDREKKCPEKMWELEPTMEYIEWIREGLMQEKPIIWTWLLSTPWEILRAMNLTAISSEFLFLLLGTVPEIDHYKYIDIPQFPEEFCSLNKIPIGMALSDDLPPPEMILYSAGHACDASVSAYSSLSRYYNVPNFFIDVPYLESYLENERGCKYVANEIKKMVLFLEEHTKQKLDLDMLREGIGYANEALEYHRKLLNLRKKIPCPLFSRGLQIERDALWLLLGHPVYTDWIRRRYESVLELVEEGEREISQEEKIRCILIGNFPNSTPAIFDWLESEYGAVAVAAPQADFLTEPIDNRGDISKVFDGIARRLMHYPMARHGRLSADYFIDECIQMARDYKADCAIMFGHTGCKWNWATTYLVKDKIQDVLGIPVMSLEFDSVDSRFLPIEAMQEKFREFFEVVF